MNGIGALIKETQESTLTTSTILGYNERQIPSEKADPHQVSISASALIFDFPASVTVRNKFLLFISHLVMVFCYCTLNGLRHPPFYYITNLGFSFSIAVAYKLT